MKLNCIEKIFCQNQVSIFSSFSIKTQNQRKQKKFYTVAFIRRVYGMKNRIRHDKITCIGMEAGNHSNFNERFFYSQ